MNWSDILKTYRKQHDLSQHALAVKLGVTGTTIHRIEQKGRKPSPMLRDRLQELGVILAGEEVSQR